MDDTQEIREAFGEMLNRTFKVYQKPPPDRELKRTYFEALKSYSIDDVREALVRHLRDADQGQFIPKPADVIRNIDGNTNTQAEMAWTKVDKAIRMVGPYRSVAFDDPIIHTVITDMGGWILLCGTGEDEYPFKHNEFIKRYRGYSGRGQVPAVSKLIGMAEHENSKYPDRIEPPILVGDRERAERLLAGGLDERPPLFHTAGSLLGALAIEKKNGSR